MKLLIFALFLGVLGLTFSGCENLYKNTRQTGKNINALLLDGYQNDLYAAK
jgi:hypothetical protein